jgi:hypothetical protein
MQDDTELSATGEPAAPDHVGLALRAILAGVLAGLGAVAAMMWLVRTLQVSGAAPRAPTPSDPIATIILGGWMGGAFLGGLAAWSLLSPLRSAYRRGGLAMVAGFAGLLVAFVTAPVDSLFGRWGLLALAALAAVGFVMLARRIARRNAAPATAGSA